LVSERHCLGSIDCELALADHVHELDAGEHAVSGSERFDVEHGLGHSFDGAMSLLDDVVEVFRAANTNHLRSVR